MLLDGGPLVYDLLVLRSGHPRPSLSGPSVPWVSLPGPTGVMTHPGRQPFFDCFRVLGQVVLCRCQDRGRGLVIWPSVDRAHILHTSSAACSAPKAFLHQLMFARSIARALASSTAPLRVQVHLRDREREFLGIRGVSRLCSGPVWPGSSCSRAPST